MWPSQLVQSREVAKDLSGFSDTSSNRVRHEAQRHSVVQNPFSPKHLLMFGLVAFAAVAGAAVPPMNDRNPVIRHASGLELQGTQTLQAPTAEPTYGGHLLPDNTPSFYKPNSHRLLNGERVNVSDYAHGHYFEADNTKDLGKEIVVHRGLYDKYNGVPENSMGAIENAYSAGFRSLELDIQVTADGVLVMLHDFTLGRMTGDPGNRLVSHVQWDELKDTFLVIRNPVDLNYVRTSEKVMSVKDALLEVARTKPDLSIALDCKEQTAEAAFDMLLNQPELRKFTALKLYAKAYTGGFDQFLGNLHARYGIDPQSEADRTKRLELLETLKEIKVVPVFSEGIVQSEEIHRFFPAQTPEGQQSAEGLAESAMGWIQGWRAMGVKVVEARSSGTETLEGRAMLLLNQRLALNENGLSNVATSAAYRFEDFSVEQKDAGRRYYTWQIFGSMNDVTDNPAVAKTETAGTFRHEGENVLTDQPVEEVYANMVDQTLARGHTGVELDAPRGTTIDTTRNKEIIKLRTDEFLAEKQQADADRIAAVRAGRRSDEADPPNRAIGVYEVLAPATALAAGAFVTWYAYRKELHKSCAAGVQQMASHVASEVRPLGTKAAALTVNAAQLVVDAAQLGLDVVQKGVHLVRDGVQAARQRVVGDEEIALVDLGEPVLHGEETEQV